MLRILVNNINLDCRYSALLSLSCLLHVFVTGCDPLLIPLGRIRHTRWIDCNLFHASLSFSLLSRNSRLRQNLKANRKHERVLTNVQLNIYRDRRAKMAGDGWSLSSLQLPFFWYASRYLLPRKLLEWHFFPLQSRALQFFVTSFPPYSPSISFQREFDVVFAIGIHRVASRQIIKKKSICEKSHVSEPINATQTQIKQVKCQVKE